MKPIIKQNYLCELHLQSTRITAEIDGDPRELLTPQQETFTDDLDDLLVDLFYG